MDNHFAFNEAVRQKLDNDYPVVRNKTEWHHAIQSVMFAGFCKITSSSFYRTSGKMYVDSIGTRYDYTIYTNNLYKDKETTKNGISGVGGFEFSIPSLHLKTGVYVNIPFYDYFNKDYTPDSGKTYPFKDAKDKRWGMEMFWRYGF